MKNISFIFPLYNEEKRIEKISYFLEWVSRNKINDFEIILISNGSTDNTNKIIYDHEKKYSFIRSLHINEKSRGKSIKLGINEAKYNFISICAIDNAWDLNFYIEAYQLLNLSNYSVVFGPKTHEKSEVNRPIFRKIISFVSSAYLKILFGNIIDQDTQCIKMFKKNEIFFIKNLSDNNLFSDVEFFIFTKMNKLKYLSIPVMIKDNKGTVSIKMMLSFVHNAIRFRLSKNYKNCSDIYNKD